MTKPRILIVEDNPHILGFLKAALEQNGFIPVFASDIDDLLASIQRLSASRGPRTRPILAAMADSASDLSDGHRLVGVGPCTPKRVLTVCLLGDYVRSGWEIVTDSPPSRSWRFIETRC